jgi:hypothetical protein
MPSYHPKESNTSMIFILGGDEDDHIAIDMNVVMNMNTNIIQDISIDKYNIKSYKFINNLLLFIKTIFLL